MKSPYNAEYSTGLVVSITIHYYSHTVICDFGYLLSKGTPINRLLFMEDLKLCGKTECKLQSLIHTVWIMSKDIGMEFGMDKCNTVRIKKGKICDMEDTEIRNGQQMKQNEGGGYKYLGIIQDNEIKTLK